MSKSVFKILLKVSLSLVAVGCGNSLSDSFSDRNNSSSSGGGGVTSGLLYVVSGACYAGGVATSTGVSSVVAYDLNGNFHHTVVDYNRMSPGDFPVSIAEYDASSLLVLVENTSGRRIELARKDGSGVQTYIFNSTALSGVVRKLTKLPDSSLLVSKSTAIERFSSGKSRVTQGTNPYVIAPAGSCATSTTLISSQLALNTGKIVYAHAAVSPNNKLGVISATGYASAADCLAAQAAPNTLALPTALHYHSSGKILAAYASTTTASNFIYAYDVNEATGVMSNATASFSDPTLVNGPSAITENPADGDVFVANGNSAFNTIERFSFNPATKILTRVGSLPFINSQIYTRCVSDLKVFN